MMQRFSKWLLTKNGQNFIFGTTVTAAVGVFSWEYFPHTFLLDKYQEIVQMYKSGFSVPVTNTVKERFKKALELADIAEEDRKLYKPFTVYGFDIFSAGSIYSKYGCIVGMPINFTYEDVDNINKFDIKLSGNSVSWELNEGQELLNSLILSEKAQLYAMAREIKMRDTPKIFFDSFYAPSSIVVLYAINAHFNRKLNLHGKPVFLRVMLYCLTGAFIFGNYMLAKDYTQLYYESKIDTALKKRDPILCDGGTEFYNKILQRNKALRKLLGKEGEHQYTALGNENYLIRQKHLPLIHRKEFFESDGKAML